VKIINQAVKRFLNIISIIFPKRIKVIYRGVKLYINPRDTKNLIDTFRPKKSMNNLWIEACKMVSQEGDKVIDIGANIGYTSVIIFNIC